MEVPCYKKYVCNKCSHYFRDSTGLQKHLDRLTSCIPNEIPVIIDDNSENRCQFCNKTFATKSSLTRHQKICDKPANLAHIMSLVQAKMEAKVDAAVAAKMEQMQGTGNTPTIVVNNNAQNLYVGNNLCVFGEEDYTLLDQTKMQRLLLDEPEKFVPGVIREIHANSDFPQYHNVFYEPKTEKTMVFARTMVNGIEVTTWVLKEIAAVSKILVTNAKRYPTCMPLAQGIRPNSAEEDKYCRGLEIVTREYEHSDIDLANNKQILSTITDNPAFHKMVANTTYVSYAITN